MTTYQIGLLKGDGIGPEIVNATVNVVNDLAEKHEVDIEWIPLLVGWEGIHKAGHPLPSETMKRLKDCHAWLLGPHDSASYPEQFKEIRNPSGELRHVFDLYANIRPAKSLPRLQSMVENTDLVIFRENTEGFYVDRNMYAGLGEFQVTPDVALTTGVFTRKAVERIAHAAFQEAMKRRKKVTIVHKANVIRHGMGLFLRVCQEVAEQYPEVSVDDYHIDAMCAHLVRRSPDFDIIVTENMYGDILSDLTGELVGSLGLAPSINTNMKQAMAQAAHGSAPDIAGKDIANPIGMLLSTAMLLEWLANREQDERLRKISESIENQLQTTLLDGVRTKDLGGEAGTQAFAHALKSRFQKVEREAQS